MTKDEYIRNTERVYKAVQNLIKLSPPAKLFVIFIFIFSSLKDAFNKLEANQFAGHIGL